MESIKIAVCDDEKALQELLQSKIEEYCKKRGTKCQISCFDSGESFLSLPAEQMPDILFLDIQMPGKTGMEIARQLRRRGSDIIIIFVTALPEYVYEAFDVGAFHYLVKPFDDIKLQEILEKALKQYGRQNPSAALQNTDQPDKVFSPLAILIKRGDLSTKVFLSDIIYAEVFNRKVMLHTINGDIEYYGKLSDLSEQAGADFYRTHRAYLVNLKYVEKYNASTIWLEQGTALLSKKQFAGFVRQYMQYINRQKNTNHRKPL